MISTHILDLEKGAPAGGVSVNLERLEGQDWQTVKSEKTNSDGRINFDVPMQAGDYRLTFALQEYASSLGREAFFLDVPVLFRIKDLNRNYHVPLLLSPFGYSTYRGS